MKYSHISQSPFHILHSFVINSGPEATVRRAHEIIRRFHTDFTRFPIESEHP